MEILNQIIRTLNTIHVSGEEDMNKLLGCINALKSINKTEGTKEGS